MSRFLFLMRHAQSADKQQGQPDKLRELTSNGTKDSIVVGNFLSMQKEIPDLILTSTAVRAKATAMLVAECMKFPEEKIQELDDLYDASLRTFLALVNRTENPVNTLMCVGHNPAISYFAEFLTEAELGDITPAGVVLVKFNCQWNEASKGNGELVHYTYPELLNR